MRILHIMMDSFPELVSNCHKKIPYQQIVRDPGHPPIDIGEQLMFFLIERDALNVAICGSTPLFLDMSDKALFQNSKTNLISRRCAATLTITDSMRLTVENNERKG